MLRNIWHYTQTVFNINEFLNATGNVFMVVSQRPYLDKNGKVGHQGTTLTLMVLQDNADYGVDKETGAARESNKFETFDVTILNGETALDVKKGDKVSLIDFDDAHSYVIGFDVILRFKDFEKIEEAE